MDDTPLAQSMRAVADAQEPETAKKLRDLADALDAAADDRTNVKRLLGAWARARRFYCEVTGEPLI